MVRLSMTSCEVWLGVTGVAVSPRGERRFRKRVISRLRSQIERALPRLSLVLAPESCVVAICLSYQVSQKSGVGFGSVASRSEVKSD